MSVLDNDAATTIYAPATVVGRSALTVLRLSGPGTAAALRGLTGRDPPPARRARLCHLRHPHSGEVIDQGLVLWFPGPHSATGEDAAELHLHGGRAVLHAVVEALVSLPNLRPAGPGEFTQRAFLHGKLDLTAAEAIADLVDAETSAQRRQALRQMDGALGRLYTGWANDLTHILAYREAAIDFADDEVPGDLALAGTDELVALVTAMEAHLGDDGRGERLREGASIAIIGPPNVGKSSLLNALARRDAAIVAARAGTTRDVIEVGLDLAGYPVTLADTAGLHESADDIEREGIRRARARAAQADLTLIVIDTPLLDPALLKAAGEHRLLILNKADTLTGPRPEALLGEPVLAVSARTGEGLPALEARLGAWLAHRFEPGAAPVLTRARHRAAVTECLASVRRALTAPAEELACEDLRLAVRALGRITGRVDVDDLLDIVFREFCIGK